jgi:hypothetical protein
MIAFLNFHGPLLLLICLTLSFVLVLFVFLIVVFFVFFHLICAHGALLGRISLAYIDISLTPRFSVFCGGVCLYDPVVVT